MPKEPEIVTFGCRLNTYESEIIQQNLNKEGIKDITVYNSCAVTGESVRQLKYSIRKKGKMIQTLKLL